MLEWITNKTTMCDHCEGGITLYACRGCRIARYCNEECQRADWLNHKSFCKGIFPLFEQICIRLNKDPEEYRSFADYMLGRDQMDRSISQWIEDWLDGPYSEDVQRRLLLREQWEIRGKLWTPDVFPLYKTWSHGKEGSRYQKMMMFIKAFRNLF